MPTLSIIIPIYNEEQTLKQILGKVENAQIQEGIKKEIVLVDDGSKDTSRDILKGLEEKYKVVYHEKNQGKGAAIRTGLTHASGDILLIQDADLEYDPADYEALLAPILEKKTQVVYGSRFMDSQVNVTGKDHVMLPSHYLGNKFLTMVTNLIYGSKMTDMETCYKVFTREVLEKVGKLRAQRFDFEPEITAKILKRGFKVVEIPIINHPRSFEQGKKITKFDGILALYYLLKYRFFD